MKFIRQKLSVYISQILLIFFVGMGTVECLHHDFFPEHSSLTTFKSADTKSAVLQKYQLSCELCKSISNHQHTYFDIQDAVPVAIINLVSSKLLVQDSHRQVFISKSTHSGRGPPKA